MSTTTYAAEKQIAIAAVRRACVLTASVFNKLVKQEMMTKEDASPVTGTSVWPLGLVQGLMYACGGG